jgi:hypothetical protein
LPIEFVRTGGIVVVRARRFEVGDDAIAHLGRGLDGEGERKDLGRVGKSRVGEQFEVALDEQAGLARSCGRFDDERAGNVECLGTGVRVGRFGGMFR